ncbi:thioredoxin family protein [Tropicimonas isoalkanivorans]|uniref:Thioredoxin-like domain-containing protein n=1 Tax=Tropicimonas isoalkanivorans TaxID=441112 RepID=A0A1I1P6E4_9RHOB|nr:thioredoxin family protein [Tropicimonas isoalkanivorans]SFD05379.1 Thioredoxin-like domain-containing protein [Tropicimonas isoalkanivorans]
MIRSFLGAVAILLLSVPLALAEIGDDGLHKEPWMRDTFKDLREDLQDANAEGKRLMLIFEQRGCIYCKKMHEEVFSDPEVSQYIEDNFFVVQLNMHGATEVTDLDGDVLPESDMARKWGLLFTPLILFLPEEVPEDMPAHRAAVATMPGAFSKMTTYDLLTWVNGKLYEVNPSEDFQRYHARMIKERGGEQ